MDELNTLVLEIFRQDNALGMSLSKQEELASTLKHYSKILLSSAEIERLCQEVAFVLNKAGSGKSRATDFSKGLKKAGQLLWDHLLTRQVKEGLHETKIQSLTLSLDEELIHVPWELLYDGSEFLCLRFNLGRLVRTKEPPAVTRYRNSHSTLKMLILANPTNDLRDAYAEGLNIKNQFDRKRNCVHIDFKSTYVDKLYVKKNISGYEIVHFAGHGEFDLDNPRNTGWVLSDGRFTPHDILSLGDNISMPSLVFSNACNSARPDDNLTMGSCRERNYSLASAFLFSGVRHYIGAIRRIEDPLSEDFAKEFYGYLISGRPVGECVRLSRQKLIKDNGLSQLTWASYLLYGDPNFSLFGAKIKPGKGEDKGKPISLQRSLIYLSIILFCLASGAALFSHLPTLNPGAYASFLKAQDLFSKGSNEAVISLSCQAISSDPFLLATYPQLAETYLRLGELDKALKCYFDYAISSEKKRHKRDLSQAYIGIGWVYYLQRDYVKSAEFYNKAISLARENKDRLNEAIALRKLAVWHIDKEEYDLALEYLMKSSEINRERQALPAHRYNLACDYFDIGLVFTDKNDYPAAREFYDKSRLIFEKLKLKDELSDYYFSLGEIYMFEKQYQKAIELYDLGLKIDLAHNNKLSLAADYNMLGELYMEMDNSVKAETYFRQSKDVAKAIHAQVELGNAYQNLGLLYQKVGLGDKAKEHFRLAREAGYLEK